jgi:hypothetical protein
MAAPTLQILGSITPRDRLICRDLFEHKVLTTHQIARMYFDSSRRARRRLLKLYDLRIVDRFERSRDLGSYPMHYLLGEVGFELIASDRSLEGKELRLRRDRIARAAQSSRLDHLVAVNEHFSHLVSACRTREDVDLVEWWSEGRCFRTWQGLVNPDGVGVLRFSERTVSFFVEVDRGSERPGQVADKLVRYQRVSRLEGAPDLLLFEFPTPRREAEVRRLLHDCGLVVATTTFDRMGRDALGPVWLALDSQRRQQVSELVGQRAGGDQQGEAST